MVRLLLIGFIILLNHILQSTLIQTISINGITPNLILISTVSFGLLRDKYEGIAIGFITGLLVDIFFGRVIGFNALIYTYIGLICGYLKRSFYRDSVLIPVFIIAGWDFIYGIIVYIFTYLFRGRLNLSAYLANIIIPEVVYTTLIGVIVYRVLLLLNDKLELYEKKGAIKP